MAGKTTTNPPVTCPPVGDESELFSSQWLEQTVLGIFRLWHMIFLCIGGMLTVIIFICCVVRVRIPRTKQDIEADFKRKKITKKFRKQLDKLTIEDTNLKSALERVTERVGTETQENGAAPTSDTPATTPGSTKSLANVAIISNSVPIKPATSSVLPQTTQSSTEDEEMTSAQSARMKLRKALLKAKQQTQSEDSQANSQDG